MLHQAGASEDQPGAGLADGAAGRRDLSGEDAAHLVDLFAGAERGGEQLRYLQGRERALEGAGVCVFPDADPQLDFAAACAQA